MKKFVALLFLVGSSLPLIGQYVGERTTGEDMIKFQGKEEPLLVLIGSSAFDPNNPLADFKFTVDQTPHSEKPAFSELRKLTSLATSHKDSIKKGEFVFLERGDKGKDSIILVGVLKDKKDQRRKCWIEKEAKEGKAKL